jgi:hypothetical protein
MVSVSVFMGMKGYKIIDPKQIKIVTHFLNIERNFLTTNADIWFNKQCVYILQKLFLIV